MPVKGHLLLQASSTGTSGVSSKSITFDIPVAIGSLIVVGGHVWRASDPSPIGVTDNIGTTYQVFETATQSWASGLSRGFIAIGRAVAAAAPTITVTPSGSSSFIGFYATEIPYINGTPLDVDGGESSGSSTTPSDGITTLTDNALIFGLLAIGASGTFTMTPDASLFMLAQATTSANAAFSFVWRRGIAAGAYTINWGLSPSAAWRVITVAVKG